MKIKKLVLTLATVLSLNGMVLASPDHVGDYVIEAGNGEPGDLSVDGDLHLGGNLDFGTTLETTPRSAVVFQYEENGTTYEISIEATRESARYFWRDDVGNGSRTKMLLNQDNKLVLYDPAAPYDAKITLDPSTSTITIGDEQVLTTSSGAAPYLPSSIPLIQGVGPNSMSSVNSVADGFYSFAWGINAFADKSHSFAWGVGNAGEDFSIAMGAGVNSSGYASVAMGQGVDASGDGAFAAGIASTAAGFQSSAFGGYTTAQGYGQFVIGRYNVLQGTADIWTGSDDLFIIGNGTNAVPSNAFKVKQNGNTWVGGNLTVRDNVEIATGSNEVELHLNLDGMVVFKGLYDGLDSLQAGDQGAGTRMLWYPGKGAFRAGHVTGTQWDEANIGDYSVAMGSNSIASGDYSFAVNGTASGNQSFAFGGNASKFGSVSLGGSASGSHAFSMGNGAWAQADNSVAFGVFSTAGKDNSIAAGFTAGAYGDDSVAIGTSATTTGTNSLATSNSTAQAYNSVVVGRYNTLSGDSTTWVDADPLFVIGNGSSGAANDRSDALVVKKNGENTLTNRYWNSSQPKDISTDPNSSGGNALVVKGHTLLEGRAIVGTAQGDIPMFNPNP